MTKYILLRHEGDVWDVLEAVTDRYTYETMHYAPYLTGLTAEQADEIVQAMNAKHARDMEAESRG